MLIRALSGTWRRTRTVTPVKEPDFESGASTNFATQALGEIILPKPLRRYKQGYAHFEKIL
jgi:hypothetical protein